MSTVSGLFLVACLICGFFWIIWKILSAIEAVFDHFDKKKKDRERRLKYMEARLDQLDRDYSALSTRLNAVQGAADKARNAVQALKEELTGPNDEEF